ncbi:MAG TPA: energy transducer TonB [Opitutaceae bacterium]|nr:energy transducer TonB [Opitutaceae bacterium]
MSLVPPGQRSAAFDRVSQELDLGGTLYGYVDVNGDAQKLAHMVQPFLQAPPGLTAAPVAALREKLPEIFTALGFDDITAMGVSSVPERGGQFRNRAFFYTPNGRHGLLQVLGGPAAPFANLHLAPTDADFYAESEIDMPALYAAIKKAVEQVSGPAMADGAERQLDLIGKATGWSILEFIHALKGRITMFGRFEPGQTYRFPGDPGLVTPRLLFVARLDGIGSIAERILAKSLAGSRTAANGRTHYRLSSLDKVEGMHGEIMIEGEELYFTTDSDFLEQCLSHQAGLEANPDFQRLLAELGPGGNSVNYIAANFVEKLRSLPSLNPGWAPATRRIVSAVLENQRDPDPMMLVRSNLPDGIQVRARYNRSFKRELALPAIYNPLTLALFFSVTQLQKLQAAQQAALQAQARGARLAPPADEAAGPMIPPGTPNRQATPIFQPLPAYPRDFNATGAVGFVEATFFVSAQGTVFGTPDIWASTDPEFSLAAVRAISRWRFRPAVQGGKAIFSNEQVPLLFIPPQALEPASRQADERADIANWYQQLRTDWSRSERGRHRGERYHASGRLWARVALGADDHIVVEEVGWGTSDPEAASARQLIEASLTDGSRMDSLRLLLKSSGHLDLALTRYLPGPPATPGADR